MIKIGIQYSFNRNSYEIFVFERTTTGRIPYKITIERLPKELHQCERMDPSFEVHEAEGKEIINALISALQEQGLLPPVTAAETELKATKYHLEDMRAFSYQFIKSKQALVGSDQSL